MQNNCGAANPPPSLTDGLANTSNTPADYIAAGMLWPYSQLFSPPYFSSHGVSAQQTTAYPIPIYCPSKPHVLDGNLQFHNSNLLRSAAEHPTTTNNNNNNNMTIQIGLQCMNEGSASTATGPSATGVTGTNCENTKKKVTLDNDLTAKGMRMLNRSDSNDGDELLSFNHEDVKIKLQEFTKLAIHGCDLAEKVTKNHKYRPCFKKIDSLCARLKQDISRPDGVLNNLNSQGIAWAVKDFIFVFTRIINAWLILKGYIYNQSEGMRKVQAAFSGNFQDGFFQWQGVTQQLIENIIESFENLDETVQKSRNNSSGGGGGNGGLSATGHGGGAHKSNNHHRMAELSTFLWDNKEVTKRTRENTGRGGGGEEKSPMQNGNSFKMEIGTTTSSPATAAVTDPCVTTPIYNEAERDEFETYYKTGLYQSMKRKGSGEEDEAGMVEMEQQKEISIVLEERSIEMDLIDKLNLENNLRKHEQETAGAIQYLLYRIRDLKEASYFFNSHFLKNYFPGFEKVIKDLKDIRTIILEAEQGKYKYTFAVVADLKMIIQSCRLYLNLNPNAQLAVIVSSFEKQLELILNESVFCKFPGI